MHRRFYQEDIEVDHRLAQLGWKRNDMLRIVEASVAGYASATANHAPGSAGWRAYDEGTGRLREIGIENGLTRYNLDGVPYALDQERGLLFRTMNTDARTGEEGRPGPKNRNSKGTKTASACQNNKDLFSSAGVELPTLKMEPLRAEGRTVWMICVYIEGDEVRAELSCPTAFQNGFIVDYIQRIVLFNGIDGDLAALISGGPQDYDGGMEEDEFSITVTRKK